jgi:uncharacterized membrane protein YdjX (TVP38/TMEM64 family)
MKRLWMLTAAILGSFLLLFIIAQVSDLPIEKKARHLVEQGGIAGMAISIALLIADVFLPIPSSLIMIANGAVYGPWLGAAISLLGGVGATAAGYLIGRGGEKAALRWVSAEELAIARRFFEKWGPLAVVISRPVPLLSETVAVMAGLSGWGWGRTLLSAVAGILPVAIIYAVSGAFASNFNQGLLTVLTVLGMGGISWGVGKLLNSSAKKSTQGQA